MQEVALRLCQLEDARQVDPHDRGDLGEQLAKRAAAFDKAKNVAIAWKLQRDDQVKEANEKKAQLQAEAEEAYNALVAADISDSLQELQERFRDACEHGRVDEVNYIIRLLDDLMLSAGGEAGQQQLTQWRARFQPPVLFQEQWPSPGLQASTELPHAYVGTVLFDEPNSQPLPSMTPEQWSAKPDGAASKARIEATDGAALKARIEARLSTEARQALESLKAACKEVDPYKIQVALNECNASNATSATDRFVRPVQQHGAGRGASAQIDGTFPTTTVMSEVVTGTLTKAESPTVN